MTIKTTATSTSASPSAARHTSHQYREVLVQRTMTGNVCMGPPYRTMTGLAGAHTEPGIVLASSIRALPAMPGPMLSSGRGQSSRGRTQLCWCPPPACQSIWEARNIPAPASLRSARSASGAPDLSPPECHRPLGETGFVKAAPLPLRAPCQLTLQSAEECGGRPFRLFIGRHTGSPGGSAAAPAFLVGTACAPSAPAKPAVPAVTQRGKATGALPGRRCPRAPRAGI